MSLRDKFIQPCEVCHKPSWVMFMKHPTITILGQRAVSKKAMCRRCQKAVKKLKKLEHVK